MAWISLENAQVEIVEDRFAFGDQADVDEVQQADHLPPVLRLMLLPPTVTLPRPSVTGTHSAELAMQRDRMCGDASHEVGGPVPPVRGGSDHR